MRWAAAVAVLAVVAVPRAPDEITAGTVAAVQRWVAAIETHVPGQRDAAVLMVSTLTFDKRVELNAGMEFFLSFLQGEPMPIKTSEHKLLASMAATSRQVPGPNAFLKRAAVLHADAAVSREIAGVKDVATPVRPSGRPSPPLLSQRSLLLNRDGEVLGDTLSDWNWPFARSLVALIVPTPGDDPFVGTWYHATAAFMFQRGLYGEVVTHLQKATALLPDDARVLFDRACYAEGQGLPRTQVLLSDRTPAGSVQLAIPREDQTNEEAERLFRRALRADPSFVEARVRLGRLLGVRKRHEEAASELATALAANPTGSVLFYAHLFAGRSAQALGKIADAAEHYKAATSLFPGAQSASLAWSQAALLESDVAAALEAIQRIDKSMTARDPWRWYHFAAGRDADALLRDMWTQAKVQ
jgi:hypothetical protein